jgi:hypothetical protein
MRLSAVAVLLLLVSTPALAQNEERLPWFAVDLHGASVGLPTAEGWIPLVSADTPVPGRAWGLAAGATVYPVRFGIVTLGLGASISTAKGKGESLTIPTGSGADATDRVTPIVRTHVLNLMPQLSVNFGHKYGWSYLSAGLGRSKVSSSADAVDTTPQMIVPDSWNQALNFGGGARWFMKPHLGAGFDVRFVKLGSRGVSGAIPPAKRTQMITFSVGISIQ